MSVTTEHTWQQKAHDAAQHVLAQHAASVDAEARWPSEGIEALRAAGLLRLTVPVDCGGAGEGPVTFAQVTQALAQGCASTAMIYMMHVCAIQVIAAAPEFSERAPVLREISAGQHLSTLAFSENGSRSHFWAPVSQARASGSTHRLTAQKSFVTSAHHADSYVVSARSVDAKDPVSSTLYYVPRVAAGVTVKAPWHGMGLRGNDSAPVDLADVEVPTGHRLSTDGEGFNAMLSVVLPWFQLGSAAVAAGLARAATAATAAHLKSSMLEHLGESLASLPNLRARLARMQILADTQSVFVASVAARMEASAPDTLLAVLESKASAGEAVIEATDLAMRACGGAAFRGDVGVERNFRDARACSIMAPTTDVLYDFIGKALLDMPLF